MGFVSESTQEVEHEERRYFVVHPKGLVAKQSGNELVFPGADDLAAFGVTEKDGHRLGSWGSADVFAIPVTQLASPFEALSLRMLAASLDPELFGVAGRAMHTCDWLTTTRFCGRCGAKTERSTSERAAICPACKLHTYPRISPAIITLVRKGDLALLASNAKFPGAFYSTLAGFADIGESLEETLVREVHEEVGVHVKNVRYFGSQPWPFPNSLMIAFTAEWERGEIEVDGSEISDAKWFEASALPMIPPPLSIARRLIDAWVTEIETK